MIKKIFSSAFWRMAASACSFFSVPVLLEKIGVDDYAVWVTLTSLIGWLSLFDFGAGYSLRNRIAESKALNETTALETVMKGNFTFFLYKCALCVGRFRRVVMLRRYFQKLHFVGGIAVCAAYREFPDVSRSVYLSGARAYSRDELSAIPAAVFMARFYLRVSRSDQ